MFSKRSVVLSWACSYIVILLIPMIAIFVNHYFNVQVVEEEVIRVNEQALINFQVYVDHIIEDEVDLYNYVYLNDAFESLLSENKRGKDFYNNLDAFQKTLMTYRSNDEMLTGMFYFTNLDYLLDFKGGGNSRNFYNSYEFVSKLGMNYDDWMEKLSQDYKSDFFISDSFRRGSDTDQIVYANTVTYLKNRRANVFIFFPVSEILKLTENSTNHFLLEKDGEYLLCVSNGKQMPLPEEVETDASGNLIISGESYICLSKESSVGKLTYKMLISEQVIKAESLHVRNVLLICAMSVIILSVMCMSIMLRRNVRPLINLLKKLGAKEIKGNEYAQIERIYNTVSQQNYVMQKGLLDKNQRIQNSELLDWLKGRTRNFSEGQVMTELQEGKRFCLVGFNVLPHDQVNLQHNQDLYFIIDNVFSELMGDQQFYKVYDGQHSFFLFVVDKGREAEWRQNCLEWMKFLCDFIEDKGNSKIMAAIGGNYGENLGELRFLYREVVDGFAYTAITGGSGVIDLENLYMEDSHFDLMVTIELAMQKKTPEEMLKSADKIFWELDFSPLDVAQIQLLGIYQKLLQFIHRYAYDESKKESFYEYLEHLLEIKTKEEINQVLEDLLLYTYKAVDFHREKTQNSIVTKVKEYVELHYADSELNVKGMAADLGWNPRYMSRIYREETKEGILEYINHVRITQAINLLNTRDLSIEEISEMVGYKSSDTFRRVFKQKKGVSPNKYKSGGT